MTVSSFKQVGLACLAGALMATPAFAAHDRQVEYDFAQVVDAQPIFAEVQVADPERVCWSEPVRYVDRGHRGHQSSGAGTVIGGLIGGAIGNQFGHGRGRAAATAAGLLIGASIGSEHDRYNDRGYRGRGHREYVRHEEVCEYRDQYRTEREVVGYDVTYEYNGRVGHTRTELPPGQEIRVRVSVDPVGY
ncbi:MAG: glycine zipper 2TM domain-containing protein [Xanthomonadales bacterium]|nr:glycine zipper 2TM domain-containing protein [Xanthomonadales bacterium]